MPRPARLDAPGTLHQSTPDRIKRTKRKFGASTLTGIDPHLLMRTDPSLSGVKKISILTCEFSCIRDRIMYILRGVVIMARAIYYC